MKYIMMGLLIGNSCLYGAQYNQEAERKYYDRAALFIYYNGCRLIKNRQQLPFLLQSNIFQYLDNPFEDYLDYLHQSKKEGKVLQEVRPTNLHYQYDYLSINHFQHRVIIRPNHNAVTPDYLMMGFLSDKPEILSFIQIGKNENLLHCCDGSFIKNVIKRIHQLHEVNKEHKWSFGVVKTEKYGNWMITSREDSPYIDCEQYYPVQLYDSSEDE